MSFSPLQATLAQCASSSVALKLTARPQSVKVSPDHCVLYWGRRRLLYYLWYIIIIFVRCCKVTFYFTINKVFKLIFLKVDENSKCAGLFVKLRNGEINRHRFDVKYLQMASIKQCQ